MTNTPHKERDETQAGDAYEHTSLLRSKVHLSHLRQQKQEQATLVVTGDFVLEYRTVDENWGRNKKRYLVYRNIFAESKTSDAAGPV